MTDLAEFLLARIGEDETLAQAASAGEWIADGRRVRLAGRKDMAVAVSGWDDDDLSQEDDDEDMAHIAHWHATRVLAECEAKRAIIERHQPREEYAHSSLTGVACAACVEFHDDADCENESWPCLTLRVLALPYAAHPLHRRAWNP